MTVAEVIRVGPAPDQVPELVFDRLLWCEGQRLAARHRPDAGDPDRCGDPRCGERFPCRGARLADKAIRSSTAGWHRSWTTRLDLLSIGIRVGHGDRAAGSSDVGCSGPGELPRPGGVSR